MKFKITENPNSERPHVRHVTLEELLESILHDIDTNRTNDQYIGGNIFTVEKIEE